MRQLFVGTIWFVLFYCGVAFPVGVLLSSASEGFERSIDHTTEIPEQDEPTFLGNLLLISTLVASAYGTLTGRLPGSLPLEK